MTESGKTHQDNVARIGGTAATAQGFMERRWNRYYFRALKQTVEHMPAGEIGASATVLDSSSFIIEDIKPSYDNILGRPRSLSLRHLLVALPFGAHILALLDNRIRRQQSVDLSDYVYLKVRKPEA